MFRWKDFCDTYRIPYNERGPSTKRDNIYVRCPFCNAADQDKRLMGLSLSNTYWGCWKTKDHSGKNPTRLIRALIRCSWEEAAQLAGVAAQVTLDSLQAMAASLTKPSQQQAADILKPVVFEKTFESLRHYPHAQSYLRSRGFADVVAVEERYKLLAARAGRFRARIIIPFLFKGTVVGWTARAISQSVIVRYLTYPATPVAKQILYNYDCCIEGGRYLYIVEGPFDAIKVDFYGGDSARAVGVLGLHVTDQQVLLIDDLSKRFDEVRILLDAGAQAEALKLQARLSRCRPKIVQLPDSVKDPGDLTERDVFVRFR